MAQRALARWFGSFIRLETGVGSPVWFFRRDAVAMGSLIFIVLIVLAAVFAPLLTSYARQGLGSEY
jgi:ABC-type antimicrobial peptide transport system permease subunit